MTDICSGEIGIKTKLTCGITWRCLMVKMTGSERYTLLASLLMATPMCLYRTNAIRISPGRGKKKKKKKKNYH
uniref:Uncharacterized protein n=1 Tax=Salarias fasciatus TaxID=181472 RepID=A0A672GUT5_SALFA